MNRQAWRARRDWGEARRAGPVGPTPGRAWPGRLACGLVASAGRRPSPGLGGAGSRPGRGPALAASCPCGGGPDGLGAQGSGGSVEGRRDAGAEDGGGLPRVFAGLGCRRGATAEAALAALVAARAAFGPVRIDALAALPLKAGEAGLVEAARRLGLPLLIVAAGPAPVLTRSAASLAAAGTGSAAEAAALAAAGPGARLLGARIVLGPVTCAIAIRETS